MKNLPVNVIPGTVEFMPYVRSGKENDSNRRSSTALLTNFEWAIIAFLKVCWCCLLKNIKSSPCLLKLQLVKVGAFFETQCTISAHNRHRRLHLSVRSLRLLACHGNAARYGNIYNGCRKMQRRRNHMTARGVFSCLVVELAVADICRPCRPFILYPR